MIASQLADRNVVVQVVNQLVDANQGLTRNMVRNAGNS